MSVQMDNLRGLLGIKRMDVWMRELCRVTEGVNERIYEGVLQWFMWREWRMTGLLRGSL